MEDTVLPTLEQHIGNLTDPRIDRTKLHKLLEILVIAICAVIAGADNWEDVEEFGKARLKWFRTFLELPNGIPSYDTFTRVFARLDPEKFQACFICWLKENQGHLYEDVERLLVDLEKSQYKAFEFDYEKTVNKDHGRIEIRERGTISEPEVVRHL